MLVFAFYCILDLDANKDILGKVFHINEKRLKMKALSVVFLITSFVIIITPGQDLMLVFSRAITQGKLAGVITALGVSIGLFGHTIIATLGLGAVFVASSWLFDVVKIIGAGYLIYIGYQMLKTKIEKVNIENLEKISYKKMFL